MSIPEKVLQVLRYAVVFDSICVGLAVLATILSIVRFVGSFAYPLWVLAPWGVIVVLLSIIIIVHAGIYTAVVVSAAPENDQGAAFGVCGLSTVACAIVASVQFFNHAFGWLSIESLVLLIALLVVDALIGVPMVNEALSALGEKEAV